MHLYQQSERCHDNPNEPGKTIQLKIQSDLNSEHLTQTIRELMEEKYDLGEVTRIKEVLGGYCNKSFAVWMSLNDRSHRYFLRLYQPNAIKSEILFEHALLNYLRSNGFTLAADILACRNGETLVSTPAPENHSGSKALWALFEFLEGEDKYSPYPRRTEINPGTQAGTRKVEAGNRLSISDPRVMN